MDKQTIRQHRYIIEENEKWNEWIKKIPYINFPSSWKIKVIPPFAGAMVRFTVTKEGKSDFVSVYLDVYENLGYFGGKPHWEVYPVDDENIRCEMEDTTKLLSLIKRGLRQIK